VAVFVPNQDFDIAQAYISYFCSCFQSVRDNVAFSLLHPIQHPPRFARIESTNWLLKRVFKRENRVQLSTEPPQEHCQGEKLDPLHNVIIPSPRIAKPLFMFLNGRTTWRPNSNNMKKFQHFKKEIFAKYNKDYNKEARRDLENETNHNNNKLVKGYKREPNFPRSSARMKSFLNDQCFILIQKSAPA
jgi:hypothetical protein